MMSDAFISLVSKDCPPGSLLARARREGDLERVFGAGIKVDRLLDADYLYRAIVPIEQIGVALLTELQKVTAYDNFKDSVKNHELHSAYMKVWSAMASVQHPGPYSERHESRSMFAGLSTDKPLWDEPREIAVQVEERKAEPQMVAVQVKKVDVAPTTVRVRVKEGSPPTAPTKERPTGHAKPAVKPSKKDRRK